MLVTSPLIISYRARFLKTLGGSAPYLPQFSDGGAMLLVQPLRYAPHQNISKSDRPPLFQVTERRSLFALNDR